MTAVYNSALTPQAVNAPILNVLLSTAMTNTKAFEGSDAAGTALGLVYTAAGTNATGSKLPDYARVSYASTTAATPSGTSNATVVRFFLNNGSANTTVGNNTLIGEVAVPAITYSNTAAFQSILFPLGFTIPNGYKIYAGLATAMGGTNCALCVNIPGGGDL